MDVLLLRLCRYKALRPLDEILKLITSQNLAPDLVSTPEKSVERLTQKEESAPKKPEKKSWPQFLVFLKSKKPQLSSMIEQGRFIRWEGGDIILSFPASSICPAFLQDSEREAALNEHLKIFFGQPIRICYKILESGQTVDSTVEEKGSLVKEVLSVFGPETTRVS